MSRTPFRKLDLPALIAGCASESASSHVTGKPVEEEGHCFELFRRAFDKQDPDAWEAVHRQYFRLLLSWIGPQREEAEELVNCVFTKFWHSCTRKPFSHCCAHVGQVLQYLRKCALSVRLDQVRRQQREKLRSARPDEWQGQLTGSPEELVLDDLTRHQCQAQVEARLLSDQERRVVFLSFELGLSPSEIMRRCPHEFADVEEVRRIKERIVKRLKADTQLREWLE